MAHLPYPVQRIAYNVLRTPYSVLSAGGAKRRPYQSLM